MTSQPYTRSADEKLSLVGSLPFFGVHLMALFVFYTGATVPLVLACVGLYFIRMFGVTAVYHRYFAHRTYKTSRVFQFVLALIATTSSQKGVLWWAAHHRHHHKESDTTLDIHSPIQRGFWWSHVGWILCAKYNETKFDSIKDFARYPELRWLNKYWAVPPVALAVLLFIIGGFPLLVWGFFLNTVLVWHGTFTINSLSHVIGSRRYRTSDTSRNNGLLAVLTMGEGWHNNHHYHQNTANQGWFWWEIDASYYILKAFSWVGLVWDLKTPSESVRNAHLKYTDEQRAQLKAESGPFGFGFGEHAVDGVRASVRGAVAAAADKLDRSAAAAEPMLERS